MIRHKLMVLTQTQNIPFLLSQILPPQLYQKK